MWVLRHSLPGRRIFLNLMAVKVGVRAILRAYVTMLEILSYNRDLNLDIREEFDMLAINLEKLPSYQIGKTEGVHEQSLTIATKLLAEGEEPAWVASITGVTSSEIESLKASQQTAKLD